MENITEENLGQQYALQVAVQTMKERCLQLQQRLSIVEEENMNLRVKYHTDGLDGQVGGKSDVEVLQQKIAQLSKQKSQLTHNVLMVATENRHLWNRLSKLTQANQTLGDHLTKINDTLTESPTMTQSELIRSKTFTHETPPPKLVRRDVSEDTYLDTSLEDISLKIINSIAQEKYELEKQCAQMTEMQNSGTILSTSIGFAYPNDELNDCTIHEIAENMEQLILIKDALISQKDKLKKGFEMLKIISECGALCKTCKDKKLNPEPQKQIQDEKIPKPTNPKTDIEKICPMCSKVFINEYLPEYVKHVQNHFIGEDDMFLDNFEVVKNFPSGPRQ